MSLKLEKSKKLRREYTLFISTLELQNAVDKKAVELAPKVKINGFRPGHATSNAVKENYMGKLISEGVRDIIEQAVRDEVKKENLRLAVPPMVEDNNLLYDKIEDIKMRIMLDCEPVIDSIEYNKYEAEIPYLVLSESDVSTEIQKLANALSTVKDITDDNHELQNGNVALINFTGYVDDKEFEGGKAENYMLDIGSGQFISGFEDQLIGLKKGQDKEVNIVFPSDYHVATLASKPAKFEVKILKILQKELPEINDDMAKLVGVDTLDILKTNINKDISEYFDGAFRSAIRSRLLRFFVEKIDFDLPESILQDEVEARKLKSKENNLNIADKEIELQSATNLRVWYFIRHIVASEQIKISEADAMEFLSKTVRRNGTDNFNELLEFYKSDEKFKDSIFRVIEENKVMDAILSKINSKKIELSRQEFVDYITELSKTESLSWKIKKKGLLG